MGRVPAKASRVLRWGVLSLIAVMATMAVTTDPADARSRRKRYAKKYHHAKVYSPIASSSRYAAIVVDAKTGIALHEANADSLRHPASLTKIMTLYLLFEQLEGGKIKLSSPMEVSEKAASQAPTKLGVRPGDTLVVEDAIKALVTKSANDAAVVVAEALGSTEEAFAKQMTRKARALGMNKTTYRNASGLPDDEQVTTAREQAVLGMAIQERFPRYYRYFSVASFTYRGRPMRNHNKLLGRVDGVDGIKTGYTRASGFNLVSSVRRNNRHIVAVVLGGSSGGQRDARMRSLIDSNIMLASTTATTKVAAAAPVAAPIQVAAPEPAAAPAVQETAAPKLAAAASVPATMSPPAAKPSGHALNIGSTDPIKPVPVKTVVVKLAPPKVAPAKPAPVAPEPVAAKPAPMQTASLAPVAAPEPAAVPQAAPPAKPSIVSPAPSPPPPGARPGILGVLPVAAAAAGKAIVPTATAAEPKPLVRSGWAIQIGAYEAEAEAKQRLSDAQSKAGGVLNKADPYTERTIKGDKTYYRARFAGFDRDQAEAACKQLKRSEISCISLKI
jgi:D-alanyl-D-alanine carboxypeptidase